MLDLIAALVTLSALFSYVNHRWVGLPTTIGVMLISLVFSLAIIAIDASGLADLHTLARTIVGQIDFNVVLMQGMLSLLLFAGAMHVDLSELAAFKWPIGVLATVGGSGLDVLNRLAELCYFPAGRG